VLAAAEAEGVDLAVIDTRPSAAEDAALVAALWDVVLIPTQPAIFDLRAILGTIDTVKGAIRRSMIVLNRCQAPRGAGEATEIEGARRAADPARANDGPDGGRGGTGREGRPRDARAVARGGEGIGP
jgi:MinD superfamily P-loop ATPase